MRDFFKDSFRKAMPLFIGLSLSIIVFFLIYRYDGVNGGVEKIISILKTFVYGGVMAYLLKTPYNWTREKLTNNVFKGKKPGLVKALSLIFVLFGAILILYLLLVMIIPALIESLVSIAQSIPGALTELEKIVTKFTEDNPEIGKYIDQAINNAKEKGPEWIKNNVVAALGGITQAFGSLFGLMYNLLIGVIVCIYILLGKETFGRQARMLVYAVFRKEIADKIIDEFAFIDNTFVGFFSGKILDSAIVGVICYIFCLILQLTMGMHNAVLIAVIVGVTNIIPFFGPYIGAIPSALIILMDSPVCCVIFVIFIIILQQFDGNVLGPMLLSKSVGLSGFWVLFSITLFGGLFGIVGILIGVPVFAVIYDLIKRWVYMMLERHNVTKYLPKKKDLDTAGN